MLDYRIIAEATQSGAWWCETTEGDRFAIMADGSQYPCQSLADFGELCQEWVREHANADQSSLA